MLTTVKPDPVANSIPLAVDIDALLPTDLWIESLLVLVRERPGTLLRLAGRLARGKAQFRQQLAQVAPPDVHSLPYQPAALAYLGARRQAGRSLILVVSSNGLLARAVAQQLKLFDDVLDSNGASDLRTECKRDRLVTRYGARGFDYLGASSRDVPIWKVARRAVLVSASRRLTQRVELVTPVEPLSTSTGGRTLSYLKALHPHQWVKNVLIFVPLAAAHGLLHAQPFARCLLAFTTFCLCASSGYLFNDLLDLPSDRSRPETATRPLASGQIRPLGVLMLQAALLLMALAVAWHLGASFLWILVTYYLLTCTYSLALKRVVVLDVLVLAACYSLRLAAGAVAVNISLSAWLIALCGALFMSLALLKRYAELIATEPAAGGSIRVRGYEVANAPIVAAQGIASGHVTVLVLALYTNADRAQRLYAHPQLFWAICVLLIYWINYMWLMARRGRIPHDPVLFALKDRVSVLLISAMGIGALLAV